MKTPDCTPPAHSASRRRRSVFVTAAISFSALSCSAASFDWDVLGMPDAAPRIVTYPASVLPILEAPTTQGVPLVSFIDVTAPPAGYSPLIKGTDVANATTNTTRLKILLRDFRKYNSTTVRARMGATTFYFPPGDYVFNDTLDNWDTGMTPDMAYCGVRYRGAGRDRTRLTLVAGSMDAGAGTAFKPFIKLGTDSSTDATGQPNAGFANYVEHLKIIIATNNRDAYAIEGNIANCGAIAYVDIEFQGLGAKAGLAFPCNPGPAFMKNVKITGPFTYGVYAATYTGFNMWGQSLNEQAMNQLTFENLTVDGYVNCAFFNGAKNVQIRNFFSQGPGAAIKMQQLGGAIFLSTAKVIKTGSGGDLAALDLNGGNGYLYIHDIEKSGFTHMVRNSAGTYVTNPLPNAGEVWQTSVLTPPGATKFLALNLPVKASPEFYSTTGSDWASVTTYGATANAETPNAVTYVAGVDDDSTAIENALNSGKAVVYFPPGVYDITRNITITNPNLKKIEGFFSRIHGKTAGWQLIYATTGATNSLIIQDLRNWHNSVGSIEVAYIHNARGAMTVRNKSGQSYIRCKAAPTNITSASELYVENVGPKCDLYVHTLSAWVRSFDRGKTSFWDNDGGKLWMMGDNVESMPTIVSSTTRNGGSTELMGGCMDTRSEDHTGQLPFYFVENGASFSAAMSGSRIAATAKWDNWADLPAVEVRDPGPSGAQIVYRIEFTGVNGKTRQVMPLVSTATQ